MHYKNDIFIAHEGKAHDENPPGRGSGRYGWGTGENPHQHQNDWLTAYYHLKQSGKFTEKELANRLGYDSIRQFRARKSIEINNQKSFNIQKANELWNKTDKDGNHIYSKSEIARLMGTNEANIRNWLNPQISKRQEILNNTADQLKKAVEKNDYIDVGSGVARGLRISKETLQSAIEILHETDGYSTTNVQVPQINNPSQKTSVLVLHKKDATYPEVAQAALENKVHLLNEVTYDNGKTWRNIEYPQSIDSKRVYIRYVEDGGKDKDGVIELRRGVEDLDLGQSRYAQVRIAVDNSHYLKGMAIYSDNIPKGYDVVFNTNKSKDEYEKLEVLKEFKKDKKTGETDKDNPFGASLKIVGGQSHYIGKDGKEHLSAINKVNEEGDWEKWSKNVSSQILSKQPLDTVNKQLNQALKKKELEYEEIQQVTNPVVKKALLQSFADDCDSSAVYLKAAAFPRQSSHVILPLTSIKEDEVYAPNYKNGEKVALFRHPHQGTFEIAVLTVNNNNPEGKRIIGSSSSDAIGIHPHVAPILSGADFDGDSVLVIPTKGLNLKIDKHIKELESFDPNIYAYPKNYPHVKITDSVKNHEMGKITNLITDMTLKGAPLDEVCRATKHALVVIDALKHDLNYKQSYKDNNIEELKKKYQQKDEEGKYGGASTIISRAKSVAYVNDRKQPWGDKGINPKTGEKIYQDTGKGYYQRKLVGIDEETGKKIYVRTDKWIAKQNKSTQMEETSDAFMLSSGHPVENAYATYANNLKALANKARLDSINQENYTYSPSAKKTYAKEVESLDAQLSIAEQNAPRERQAQMLANSRLAILKATNDDLTRDDLKKAGDQFLAQARVRTGAHKTTVKITEDEWKAITAGAISKNKLEAIIRNSDQDRLKQLATPREYATTLTPAKLSMARAMLSSGETWADVASYLGVSPSTLRRHLNA